MGMTREIFKDKALSLLLGERFLGLPLFESENIEDYRLSDEQGDIFVQNVANGLLQVMNMLVTEDIALIVVQKWIRSKYDDDFT